jgi:gamma-glutamyl hercynylcysteine S-oxide hydrolase
VPWPSQPKRLAENPVRIFLRSQPSDDNPGWADIPDHHLVDVADGVVAVTELEA